MPIIPKRAASPSTFAVTGTVAATLAAAVMASLPPGHARGGERRAEEHRLHAFDRRQLTDTYFSEGAAVGDLNRDGHPDLIYGPYWYEGPTFEKRHEIYAPKPQPTDFYADNFFTWVYDFNGDGWPDLLVVGLPGTPAFVFENPGGKAGVNAGANANSDGHWPKHQVFDSIGNESPQFVDLLGDGHPVLVCSHHGDYGFVSPTLPGRDHPSDAFGPWTFHKISDDSVKEKLPHGLGVGDLNGDGRKDVVIATGWFEQPAAHADSAAWRFHPAAFTDAYGGADMLVYDVNGDGKADVITSLAAHDFGLAWYEQDTAGGQAVFRQHVIVGKRPEQNSYGIVFSEPHALALADLEGEGSTGIVSGKTYWSHHKASPQWDAGAVVYWFALKRTPAGVDWVPHLADPDAGIGRQIVVADVNADGLPDLLLGGMKGAHLLTHKSKAVDEAEWKAQQPTVRFPQYPLLRRGPAAALDGRTGKWEVALEAESLPIVGTPPGKVTVQEMTPFTPDHWSGGKQLFWAGAKPGDRLELKLTAPEPGEYDVQAVFTLARDYAAVLPMLDGKPLDGKGADGKPSGGVIDLYNSPDVLTSGVLHLGRAHLSVGEHQFGIEIKGANPSATPEAYYVGLDCLKLERVKPDEGGADAPRRE